MSIKVGCSSIIFEGVIIKNLRLTKALLTATGILGTLSALFLATLASAASVAGFVSDMFLPGNAFVVVHREWQFGNGGYNVYDDYCPGI